MYKLIRKLMVDDIPQPEILFQLTRRKTFSSRPSDNFQIGDFKNSTKEDKVWAADEDGIILGSVSIFIAENFIHNLFVYPDHQRKGTGKQLLQIAEAKLKTPMTLKVAMDNLDVGHFYTKYGWQQISVHENAKQPFVLYSKD